MNEREWTFIGPSFIAWDFALALFVLFGFVTLILILMARLA